MEVKSVYACVTLLWVGMWLGIGIDSVGERPPEERKPYGKTFPLTVLIFTSFPAVMGYWWGREDAK
jgi:hypothetical protein